MLGDVRDEQPGVEAARQDFLGLALLPGGEGEALVRDRSVEPVTFEQVLAQSPAELGKGISFGALGSFERLLQRENESVGLSVQGGLFGPVFVSRSCSVGEGKESGKRSPEGQWPSDALNMVLA